MVTARLGAKEGRIDGVWLSREESERLALVYIILPPLKSSNIRTFPFQEYSIIPVFPIAGSDTCSCTQT